MFEQLWTSIQYLLGFDTETLAWWQLLARTLLVYGVGLALVRIGKRRFMGSYSAFDMILGITVGALLSSAAGEAATFLNAIVIVFGLVLLHWLLAFLTYHSQTFDDLVKGHKHNLVSDGEPQTARLRQSHISKSDLAQALRASGITSLDDVAEAYLERNGTISIIPRSDGRAGEQAEKQAEQQTAVLPRLEILNVEVEEGVQRVVVTVQS